MSLWFAIPGAILLVIGIIVIPVLILDEIGRMLRHWHDDND